MFGHPCGFDSFKKWVQLEMEPEAWREHSEVRPAESGQGGQQGAFPSVARLFFSSPLVGPVGGSPRSWRAGVAPCAWWQRERQPGNLWSSLLSAGGKERKSCADE